MAKEDASTITKKGIVVDAANAKAAAAAVAVVVVVAAVVAYITVVLDLHVYSQDRHA